MILKGFTQSAQSFRKEEMHELTISFSRCHCEEVARRGNLLLLRYGIQTQIAASEDLLAMTAVYDVSFVRVGSRLRGNDS